MAPGGGGVGTRPPCVSGAHSGLARPAGAGCAGRPPRRPDCGVAPGDRAASRTMDTFDLSVARGGGPPAPCPARSATAPRCVLSPRDAFPNRERGLQTSGPSASEAPPSFPRTVSGLRVRTPSPGAAAVTMVGAHLGDPDPPPCPVNALPGVGSHVGSGVLRGVQQSLGACPVSFSWNVSRVACAASPGQAQVLECPRGPRVLTVSSRVRGGRLSYPRPGGLQAPRSYSSVHRRQSVRPQRRDWRPCTRPASLHVPPGGFSS